MIGRIIFCCLLFSLNAAAQKENTIDSLSTEAGDVGVLARDKKGLTSLPRMGHPSSLVCHPYCVIAAYYEHPRGVSVPRETGEAKGVEGVLARDAFGVNTEKESSQR